MPALAAGFFDGRALMLPAASPFSARSCRQAYFSAIFAIDSRHYDELALASLDDRVPPATPSAIRRPLLAFAASFWATFISTSAIFRYALLFAASAAEFR